MEFPEFIGPAYQSLSIQVDGEQCINLYPELLESKGGKNRWVLYGTPGKNAGAVLDGKVGRGIFGQSGRLFAVTGPTVWEIFDDGSHANRGTIADDGKPVFLFFTQNGSTFLGFIVSAGWVYSWDGTTCTQQVAAGSGCYVDGYAIVSVPGSQDFRISGLLDFTSWDALDFGAKQAAPDPLVRVARDQSLVWLLGERTSEVWWDSGNADFPFERIQGVGVIEIGVDSLYSVANLPQSGLIFLGRDQRGGKVVYMTNGYEPVRVSTHAIEYLLESLTIFDDAVGSIYQQGGHTFYQLDFPSSALSLVYDVTESKAAGQPLWHRRGFWNSASASYECDLARFHAFAAPAAPSGAVSAFPLVQVGQNATTGNLYTIHQIFYDDAGSPIRRVRRTPHLENQEQFYFYRSLQIDMETGVAANGNVTDPEMMLRISNDGGATWSNEIDMSAGKLGHYLTRVKARRLGRGRDRVFEVSSTAAIKHAWINAYIDLLPGSGA